MIKNPFSLANKTILITGASSGLGKAAAIAIAEMDGKLIITGRNGQRLEETYNMLAGDGHRMIVADFDQPEAIGNLVKDIATPLNGIVHCAGIAKTFPFKFTTQKILREILNINVEVPFGLTQQLLKSKMIANNASIVFLSSLYGAGTVAAGVSAYSASKGALIAAAKVMALELAPKKITVNCISPGKIQTELLLADPNLNAEDLAKDAAQYPLGHGTPEDVAYGIIYFLSDAGKWSTGSNLIMDGGFSTS